MVKPRFIQTLFIQTDTKPLKSTLGFRSAEFNWMSWALSCLQLHRLYGEVELYTNHAGKKVLIDCLQLPYSKVHVVLEDHLIPPDMWVFPKIYTYSFQTSPFIHVDGDVFLWEALDETLLHAELITQNLELSDSLYKSIYVSLKNAAIWLPDAIERELHSGDELAVYNAGLFGGSDLGFFKHFTEEAFKMMERNIKKIATVDAGEFNLVYEQHLFYCLAKQRKQIVSTHIASKIKDLNYNRFADFLDIPFKTTFIHMMGNFKRMEGTCLFLAKRLRQNYPDYYYRIISECKRNGVKISLSCYEETASSSIYTQTKGTYNLSEETINWDELYEIEKSQQDKFELTFSDPAILDCTFFVLDKTVVMLSEEKIGENVIYCLAPNSLLVKFDKIACDQLDEILIELLKAPQLFSDLLNQIKEYFDETVLLNEQSKFIELITCRIKAGCAHNLYRIV